MTIKNIVIERGKDVPPPGKRGRKRIYPFDRMSVDDSFAVTGASLQSVSSCVRWFTDHQQDEKWEFTVRRVDIDGTQYIQVNRIA